MDAFEKYCEQNKMHNFEGVSGVRRLCKMMHEICGYGRATYDGETVIEFLEDNPGACEGIAMFIEQWAGRNTEWKANLDALTGGDDPDEDEDDEITPVPGFDEAVDALVAKLDAFERDLLPVRPRKAYCENCDDDTETAYALRGDVCKVCGELR